MPAEPKTAAFEPGGSAVRLLTCRAAERPDHPFLWVEQRGPWRLGALAGEAAAFADVLGGAGVGAGDRVLLRLGNDERFLPGLAAVWLAGGAAVVMHPAAPAAEVDRVVRAFGVRAVVTAEGDGLRAFRADGGAFSGGDGPGTRTAGSGTDLSAPGPSDTALVLLTSGSTGEPKGVALTHAAVWANLAATVSAFRSDTRPTPIPAERKPPNLIANPLSHTAGVVRLLFALYVGRSVVVLRKFDARAAHTAVQRHGIDHLTLNPAMLRLLLDELGPGEDLGPVRYVSSGTAPLPPALREAFEDRFGVPVLQAYGQTEAFGGIAVENVRDVLAGRRRPGSVGRPLPGVEVRIVGPDGAVTGPGEDGEIQARSRSVTSGYLGADAAPPLTTDGWLRTGDLGHFDADGYLYITGRLKNIIICGGFNVVPEEVEARLVEDPAVRAAAVVAVPDERLGEIPVALVESDDRADDILARAADRLVAYKRPRRLFTVDTLPRVANGKVDQPAARRLAARLTAHGAGRPITAVAFDLGGVLTRTALGGLDRYGIELGLPAGALSGYFRGDPLMARLEVGEITSRQFFKYVCVEVEARHGRRVDIRRLAAAAEEGQVLDPAMLDLVAEVRAACATALVTNNVAEAGWRHGFPFHLFDVVLDSSEIGARKPDPAIYGALLDRLRRPAAEVAFVDDFAENLVPAAALGLATVLFTGIDDCRTALAGLGLALPSARDRSGERVVLTAGAATAPLPRPLPIAPEEPSC